MELGSQEHVPAPPLPQHRQGHPVGTQHAQASLVEGVPITGRGTHIPPLPTSYLEADNVWDLHTVQIAFDLGNAAASCHGLQGEREQESREDGDTLATLPLSLSTGHIKRALREAQR